MTLESHNKKSLNWLWSLLPLLNTPFFLWMYRHQTEVKLHALIFVYALFASQLCNILILIILRKKTVSLKIVGLSTVFFICLLLPSRPTISTDMYRYIWDGRVTANGLNVFLERPDQLPQLQNSDRLYSLLHFRDEYTVYHPGAQALFSISNLLYEQAGFWSVKAFMGLPFIFIGLFTSKIYELKSKKKTLPEIQRFGLLALMTQPLLLFELFSSGHLEGWAISAIVAAYYFLLKKKHYTAITLLTCATFIKIWPLLLLPSVGISLIKGSNLQTAILKICGALGCFLGLLIVAYAPFLDKTLFVFTRLQSWGDKMNFNGILQTYLTQNGMSFAATRLVAFVLLGSVVLYSSLKLSTLKAWIAVLITFFVVSPVFYPWYALVLLPLVVLTEKRLLLWLLSGQFLLLGVSYIDQIDDIKDTPRKLLLNKLLLPQAILLLIIFAYVVGLFERQQKRHKKAS